MLKPKSISINLRKREYTTSLLNTSFTTLYKWPQKSHHLYEVFHGSNHQISFVHYTGWMIWAIYWEVTISKQPDQFLRSFGSSTGRAIPCTNCGRKLILGKKELNNAYRFFFMEMKGQVSKKGGIFICSFQGALGFGTSKRATEIEQNLRAMDEGIPLNFLKTALQTRMLICCCPKDWLSSEYIRDCTKKQWYLFS